MDVNIAELKRVFGLTEDASTEDLIAAINAQLASLAGVDAAAMDEMTEEEVIKQYDEMDKADKEADPNDEEQQAMKAVREALGLKTTATRREVAAIFVEWLTAVSRKSTSPRIDVAALTGFAQKMRKAMVNAPVSDEPTPRKTKNIAAAASKTYGFAVTGRAEKPSLRKMMTDLMAGKAHNYEVGPLGGYIVRTETDEDFLEPLTERLVLREAGAQVTTLADATSYQVPRMNAVPEAEWVGINDDGSGEKNFDFEMLTVTPKPLKFETSIPIRMLQATPASAESRIREKMAYAIERSINRAAFFGKGSVTSGNTGAEPLGVLYTPNVTSTSLGTNGKKPAINDLLKQFARIAEDDVEIDDSAKFVMSVRDDYGFSRLTDANGQPLLRRTFNEGKGLNIDGREVISTNVIPTNVTTGSAANTSYIFAGVFRFLEIFMGGGIEIRVLDQYPYANNLQVGLLAYTYADILVHYGEAFDVLTGVLPQD